MAKKRKPSRFDSGKPSFYSYSKQKREEMIEDAVNVIEELHDTTDGGGRISFDQFATSTILALLADPLYYAAAYEEWESRN